MTETLNRIGPGAFSTVDSFNRTSPLVEEISEQALTKGVNIAQLIAKTYLMVEAHSQNKAHLKVDELEAHEKKLKAVTQFLSEIETQLSNRDAKEVSMAGNHSELVEEMRQLLDHKLLSKTVWSREEAEALKTSFTRHSQIIMQQIHHLSSDVSRTIEEGTELLQIARKCLEMLQQLHQTFTSNQRGR